MRLLPESEYHATFSHPMMRVGSAEAPPVDFWPYFEAIPQRDFEGFDCTAGRVDWVWRTADGRFEHVLINSNDRNVFMVLILDRVANNIVGHRLLNLRHEYGLDDRDASAT